MSHLRNAKDRFFNYSLLIFAYVLLMLAWFVNWISVGDGNWWTVLLNRVVPYLFVPGIVLFGWGVLSRHYKSALVLIVPCLMFVWVYEPYVLPRILSHPSGNGSKLSVMTYNVLFSNSDYDAVANVILAYEPDLVALQEIKTETKNALESRLSNKYPYSLVGIENDYGTTAIFSKYPFVDSYVLGLKVDRPAIIIKIRAYEQEITFVSMHLLAYNLWWTKLKDIPEVVLQRTANQNQQVKTLLDELGGIKGIVIIGCDCNSYETSSSYRILDQIMNNSAREVGWVLNESKLTNVKPDTDLQHIDYVWYRGAIEPLQVFKVSESGGSDHRPVLAVFNIP